MLEPRLWWFVIREGLKRWREPITVKVTLEWRWGWQPLVWSILFVALWVGLGALTVYGVTR